MKVSNTLISFFFLTAFHGGNSGLLFTSNRILTGTEGGNITVTCSFTLPGSTKFFCRQECKENILVETTEDTATNGRYSIEYSKPFLSAVLNVSITQLTKSDSGRYICGLDRRFFVDSHEEFEISVTDALTSLKPSWSPRLFSTSVPSDSTPTTTTQSLSSRSGSSTPSSPFPGTTSQSKQQQTEPTTTATTSSAHSGKLLYVGVMLLIKIVVLSLAVLTFCRRKARKLQKLPAETEHTYPTEAGRMYEDIREDRPSRPPPVEISSVYTCVKYTKPDKAEVSDDYSFVTDPNCTTAASSQHKAEDDSDELTYSKVVFPNSTAALLKGTPTGNTSEVLCSVPQVGGSSDPRCAEHDSAPLYSTVTLPQQ
ncbi:uncharacterized protein LOC108873296 [Lates japonicus]